MEKNSYRQVQGKAVDELLSMAPPAGLTLEQLEKWYDAAVTWYAEIEAEVGAALYLEPAIENDYSWIRGGC